MMGTQISCPRGGRWSCLPTWTDIHRAGYYRRLAENAMLLLHRTRDHDLEKQEAVIHRHARRDAARIGAEVDHALFAPEEDSQNRPQHDQAHDALG